MKLSIIVPAFKVELYIEKCIRSLEDQDLDREDYEIIVTNDGSPDRCRQIVEELQKEFGNIVLINQDNQGVSMARNNAIAMAKGAYVMSIDPDDYVTPNTLARLIERVDVDNLDVLYLGFEIFGFNGNPEWKTDYRDKEKNSYNGVEGYFAARGFDVRDPDRSVAIIYRKELLDTYQIKYPKDVPYLEDGLFLAKVFAVAQKVGFDNQKFYQRTSRKGSATHSNLFFSEQAIQGFLLAVQNIKQFERSNNLNEDQKGLINHVVAKFVLLPITATVRNANILIYFTVVRNLKKKGLDRLNVTGVRNKSLELIKIFNLSPHLFYFYYFLITKYISIKVRAKRYFF